MTSIATQGFQIYSGLLQCPRHFFYRRLRSVICHSVDLLESLPSVLDVQHPREPFQGLLANVVSRHSEDRDSLLARGRRLSVNRHNKGPQKNNYPQECTGHRRNPP